MRTGERSSVGRGGDLEAGVGGRGTGGGARSGMWAALCASERRALRGGHVEGSLVLGGRRVKVQRPRARSIGGQELSLPSWQGWSARVPLDERALDQNSWARASESAAPARAR